MSELTSVIINNFHQFIQIKIEEKGGHFPRSFLSLLESKPSSNLQLILDFLDYLDNEELLDSILISSVYPEWKHTTFNTDTWISFDIDLQELTGMFPEDTDFSKIYCPCFKAEELKSDGKSHYKDKIKQKVPPKIHYQFNTLDDEFDQDEFRKFLTPFDESAIAFSFEALGPLASLESARNQISKWEEAPFKEEQIQKIIDRLKNTSKENLDIIFATSWIHLTPEERPLIFKTVLKEGNKENPIIQLTHFKVCFENSQLEEAKNHLNIYSQLLSGKGGYINSSEMKLAIFSHEDPIQLLMKYAEAVKDDPKNPSKWFNFIQIENLMFLDNNLELRSILNCLVLDPNYNLLNLTSNLFSVFFGHRMYKLSLFWGLKFLEFDKTALSALSPLVTLLLREEADKNLILELVNTFYPALKHHPTILVMIILTNDAFGRYTESNRIIKEFKENPPPEELKVLFNSLQLLLRMRKAPENDIPDQKPPKPPLPMSTWHKLIPLENKVGEDQPTVITIENLLNSRQFQFTNMVEMMFQINSTDPGFLLNQIRSITNHSIFAADFSEPNRATESLAKLSFVNPTRMGFTYPQDVFIGLYISDKGILAIIGGSLSVKQQQQITKVFTKNALQVHNIISPGKSKETNNKRSGWKFW